MNQNLISKADKHGSPTARSGFTLVEVLTVVAIISVLMTAAAVGLDKLSAGKGTSSGIAVAESLFSEARSLAISNRTKARVLIDGDPDSDTYLRKILVVYGKADADGLIAADDDGNPDDWALSSRGYTLQQGTYFSQTYSGEPLGTINSKDFTGNLYNTDVNSSDSLDAFDGEYFYFEFNSQGISSNPGTRFIIGSGRPPIAGGDKPRSVGSAASDFAGFKVWRNGRTTSFRSPSQMGVSATAAEF